MASTSQTEYKIKTEQFEGPFGVLLELIEAQKLDITEISLSTVAEQFLEYIDTHDELPAQELADFLLVASRLLYIKSKALLPRLGPDEEDDGLSLESQLRMYKAYIDAAKVIEKRVQDSQTSFFGKIKGPELATGFYPPRSLKAEDLADAMENMLKRLEPLLSLPKVQVERVVSINEKISHIKNRLTKQATMTFREALDQGTRVDAIVSFLALLELVKNRSIDVKQRSLFEDMIIEKV
ncbi:MAG: hypothetical protein CMI52_02795 [Parcubacteria group bacterium]|nr:hypothetical protein [Parcubacteria group bacterium]|tara:strand:+ start:693 stop:1406 length:714 start_codon:yes stop_codon:yes gene_type:complete